MRRIIETFFYTVFLSLLLVVAGRFVSTNVKSPGGFEIKTVRSSSMEPAIPMGSIVIIQATPPYQAGDVIAFESGTGTTPTTHRIVDVTTDDTHYTYTTKGDAEGDNDADPVDEQSVIGAVWASVPYAGYILDFARRPVGFILLILLPAAFIIFDESWNIIARLTARRRSRADHKRQAPSS